MRRTIDVLNWYRISGGLLSAIIASVPTTKTTITTTAIITTITITIISRIAIGKRNGQLKSSIHQRKGNHQVSNELVNYCGCISNRIQSALIIHP